MSLSNQGNSEHCQMAAMRGQRFNIDLESDSDDESAKGPVTRQTPTMPDRGFIKDVVEHVATSEARPPSPPTLKSSSGGFPAHKKRARVSDFKQKREAATASRTANTPPSGRAAGDAAKMSPSARIESNNVISDLDRRQIDEENNQRLQSMSPQQIEAERQELLAGLSQSTIDRLLRRVNKGNGRISSLETSLPAQNSHHAIEALLKRANIDEDQAAATNSSPRISHQPHVEEDEEMDTAPQKPSPPAKKVAFAKVDNPASDQSRPDLSSPPPQSSVPLEPLDPSSPTFLTSLHERYFPSLPHNPSALSWLSPLPSNDPSSPYHPAQNTFLVSSLRFDFNGLLLPPALAQQIPVTKGLHHHGIAPEAAGYTLEELGMLVRSTVTAQRCVAVQTLGRVLFRLGRGDFGQWGGGMEDGEEDQGETLCRGMWGLVERLKVIDMLIVEANREEGVGSRTLRALALEAVWLWQRGGGNRGVVRAQ